MLEKTQVYCSSSSFFVDKHARPNIEFSRPVTLQAVTCCREAALVEKTRASGWAWLAGLLAGQLASRMASRRPFLIRFWPLLASGCPATLWGATRTRKLDDLAREALNVLLVEKTRSLNNSPWVFSPERAFGRKNSMLEQFKLEFFTFEKQNYDKNNLKPLVLSTSAIWRSFLGTHFGALLWPSLPETNYKNYSKP